MNYDVNEVVTALEGDRDYFLGERDPMKVAREWISAGVDVYGWLAVGVYDPEAAIRLENARFRPGDLALVDDPDLFWGHRPGPGVCSGDVSLGEIHVVLGLEGW